MSLSQIKDAVAELPDKERGSLAAWLLDSLPPHSDEDADVVANTWEKLGPAPEIDCDQI